MPIRTPSGARWLLSGPVLSVAHPAIPASLFSSPHSPPAPSCPLLRAPLLIPILLPPAHRLERVIIFEEDLQLSPDIFDYFLATSHFFDEVLRAIPKTASQTDKQDLQTSSAQGSCKVNSTGPVRLTRGDREGLAGGW